MIDGAKCNFFYSTNSMNYLFLFPKTGTGRWWVILYLLLKVLTQFIMEKLLVCVSQHALGRGECLPRGVSAQRGCLAGGECIPACTETDTTTPSPVDRTLDTRLWKYYRGANSMRTVISCFFLLRSGLLSPILFWKRFIWQIIWNQMRMTFLCCLCSVSSLLQLIIYLDAMLHIAV